MNLDKLAVDWNQTISPETSEKRTEADRTRLETLQQDKEFEAEKKLNEQKIQLQKQELQIRADQQSTSNFLAVSGVIIALLIVISVVVIIIFKLTKTQDSLKKTGKHK